GPHEGPDEVVAIARCTNVDDRDDSLMPELQKTLQLPRHLGDAGDLTSRKQFDSIIPLVGFRTRAENRTKASRANDIENGVNPDGQVARIAVEDLLGLKFCDDLAFDEQIHEIFGTGIGTSGQEIVDWLDVGLSDQVALQQVSDEHLAGSGYRNG